MVMAGDRRDIIRLGRRDFWHGNRNNRLFLLAGCNEGARSGPSVTTELAALAEAIGSLRSTVERFKGEDCKDVVSDVETDAADLATAFANLKAAMGRQ